MQFMGALKWGWLVGPDNAQTADVAGFDVTVEQMRAFGPDKFSWRIAPDAATVEKSWGFRDYPNSMLRPLVEGSAGSMAEGKAAAEAALEPLARGWIEDELRLEAGQRGLVPGEETDRWVDHELAALTDTSQPLTGGGSRPAVVLAAETFPRPAEPRTRPVDGYELAQVLSRATSAAQAAIESLGSDALDRLLAEDRANGRVGHWTLPDVLDLVGNITMTPEVRSQLAFLEQQRDGGPGADVAAGSSPMAQGVVVPPPGPMFPREGSGDAEKGRSVPRVPGVGQHLAERASGVER